MNYDDAIRFLYGLRMFGMKLGLENARRLAELAGMPQENLRFIHVAGTNGKGSTCAVLESIYRASGLRVGLFTSPHLVSFSERIQVNRQHIAEEDVARLVERLQGTGAFADTAMGYPTFFEVVMVMALIYFAEQKCDLVVWETGLGGRLDATNIVTPLASVITNVQLDHQEWLGRTLPEIAREKAGIIKEGAPVITSAEDPAALQIIRQTAEKLNAPFFVSDVSLPCDVSLAGEHQKRNAALAVKVVRVLDDKIPVSDEALRAGLKTAQWSGRFQVMRRGAQTLVLDGAHNPGGAETLARAWHDQFPGIRPALVLGIMRDKDFAGVCHALAPLAGKIFLAPVGSDRTAEPDALRTHCREANPAAEIFNCGNLTEALEKSAGEPYVLLTGSLYFVGEALECLGAMGRHERGLNEYAAPPAVRAITFDVGGTLIKPWPSVGHVYSAVAERHGTRVSPELLNRQFALAWKEKSDFAHRKSDWSNLVNKAFAGLAATPLSELLFAELYEEFAKPSAWRIFDDVVPALERLKKSGFKLAIVSNWDERLRPLLEALDLARYFEVIVISHEAGIGKPAAEIFGRAANQLAISPREILHVGDSRKEDFEGARAAGFQALLLHRGNGPSEPGTIRSLNDVRHAENKAT